MVLFLVTLEISEKQHHGSRSCHHHDKYPVCSFGDPSRHLETYKSPGRNDRDLGYHGLSCFLSNTWWAASTNSFLARGFVRYYIVLSSNYCRQYKSNPPPPRTGGFREIPKSLFCDRKRSLAIKVTGNFTADICFIDDKRVSWISKV